MGVVAANGVVSAKSAGVTRYLPPSAADRCHCTKQNAEIKLRELCRRQLTLLGDSPTPRVLTLARCANQHELVSKLSYLSRTNCSIKIGFFEF